MAQSYLGLVASEVQLCLEYLDVCLQSGVEGLGVLDLTEKRPAALGVARAGPGFCCAHQEFRLLDALGTGR